MTPERCEICGTDFCPRKWGKAGNLWRDDMITCYRLGYERASAALRDRDAEHEVALADAERRLGMLRALLAAERKEIEYLRGQVKSLNGALGR